MACDFPKSLRELLDFLFVDEYLPEEPPDLHVRDLGINRACPDMGLGAGGKIRQEIYADPYDFTAWDQSQRSRCFIHLCNSLVWRQVTGENPPHPPFTAKEYERAGLPWFDYYRDDLKALDGAERLRNVKSIAEIGREKQTQPLPENSPVEISALVQYGNTRRPGDVPFRLKKAPRDHVPPPKIDELEGFLPGTEI